MVEAPVQKPNHVQLDQNTLGTGQLRVFTPNGQSLSTLEAIQALVTMAQNTIIANTHAAITAAQADIQTYIKHELAALETRISAAEKRLERIPHQLCNARMPFNSPLQYPADVRVVSGMPIYKRDICNLLELDCIITADVLDLPPLPGEPTLAQRRAQIGEFLGVM
ncbi:hypothetical protein C0995_000262 [Termitomyces sp. Mi166|nr:hypothetical protein C0995_000262 [Termitomyces sp. Mi166\